VVGATAEQAAFAVAKVARTEAKRAANAKAIKAARKAKAEAPNPSSSSSSSSSVIIITERQKATGFWRCVRRQWRGRRSLNRRRAEEGRSDGICENSRNTRCREGA
jgi:hypothetical protein